VADFNAMAARLESAEAELHYSNTAIAHELRTPLTILRGRLQGLSDGVFAPSPQLYDTLLAHIDGLTRLVEDLRTLGLFTADRLELTLDSVDLASEAKAVLQSIEPDMAEAGIAVELALHPVLLRADAARIRQAMLAVLDNARRYAPNASVRVEGLDPLRGHRAGPSCRRLWPRLRALLGGRRLTRAGERRFRSRIVRGPGDRQCPSRRCDRPPR
jgi:two-component system sensor histidine kinase AdeS